MGVVGVIWFDSRDFEPFRGTVSFSLKYCDRETKIIPHPRVYIMGKD